MTERDEQNRGDEPVERADGATDAGDESSGGATEPGVDEARADEAGADEAEGEDGATADVDGIEDLVDAEGPDVEVTDEDLVALLEEGERDLVAEYRDRAARAEAELKNFRTRVERDRAANREAVIAEVIRSLLPAMDDLDRADAHGDLVEGSPLALVAQKVRSGFDRFGLQRVGEKGDPFDPTLHEALVQIPSAEVEVATIADVIEPGYRLGERLIRPAKVAVSTPE